MDVVERPRPIVRTIWRSAPLLSLVTGTMIIYSLALTWWAWELGIAIGKKGIPGYFQKFLDGSTDGLRRIAVLEQIV
jgi:hypothetical protein